MTQEEKDILVKRLKSLGWRTGSMMLIAGLNFIAEQLSGFGLPNTAVVLIGLVLSECTKFVSDHTDYLGAAKKFKLGKAK